ncbi:MAG: hypothetical protein [Olavius algarvensis Gamma 1 endosymbiont]|nr:MAG: hypothetical protein [Olavius algarvensis Gamma 1 endosymbiont]
MQGRTVPNIDLLGRLRQGPSARLPVRQYAPLPNLPNE